MLPLWLALLLQLQIPSPTGYVNDFAGVIAQAERERMLGMIEQVRQASGGEIVVVTLRDLGGRASIDVARDIGRAWKVGAQGGPGDRARNAGVVMLLKPGERPGDGKAELAIATGSGAEGFVTDALAGRIRDAVGRAAVDSGRYGAGLVVGVAMLGQAYASEFGFELTGAPPPPPPQQVAPARGRSAFPILLVVVLFIVLGSMGRRGGGGGLLQALILAQLFGGGRGRGGWGGGGFGGGFGGGGFGGGGGGFGGFGGGGGFSGGGASGGF